MNKERLKIQLDPIALERLQTEASRRGIKVAAAVREAVDMWLGGPKAPSGLRAVSPDADRTRVIDRTGYLEVEILNARSGQLLVAPTDDILSNTFWVPANLVSLPPDEDSPTDLPVMPPPQPTYRTALTQGFASMPTEPAPDTTELLADFKKNEKKEGS
jgi:hypothetical protein